MSRRNDIDLVIVLISGFTQRQDSESNGLLELDERIHRMVMQSDARHTTRHAIHAWSDDPSEIAGRYWRYRPDGCGPQYWVIAGYSYGGQTAVNVCRELQRRNSGSFVTELHLCDAVRRWPIAPGLAAATGLGKLVIPPNVKRVEWIRQQNPRWSFNRPGLVFQPAGHDVVAENPNQTEIRDQLIVGQQHEYIDSDSRFQMRFLRSVFHHLKDGCPGGTPRFDAITGLAAGQEGTECENCS